MPDIVRFGADATQYFDVVNRMKMSAQEAGGVISRGVSGSSAGGDAGILGGIGLKGERAVKGQAKFLVTSMLEARDATSAAGSALQAFIYSSKVGLGAAVGAGVVFTAYKIIKEQIEAVAEAKKKLDETLSTPAAISGRMGAAALGKDFEEQKAALENFRKVSQDSKNLWVDLFTAKDLSGGISGITGRGVSDRSQDVAERERQVNETAKRRGAAELQIAEAKARAIKLGTEEAEIALLTLQYEQKKAELVANPDQGTPTRLKALDVEKGMDVQKIKDKHESEEKKRLQESADFELKNLDDYYDRKTKYEKEFEKALGEAAKARAKDAQDESQQARDVLNLKKSPTDPTGLLGDVGKIAQDPQAYQKKIMDQIAQEKAGQALIDEAKARLAAQNAGFDQELTPEQAEMYNRVLDAESKQTKATSLEELSKMDFSAIAKLGDPALDFSGIANLAGLTIIVE